MKSIKKLFVFLTTGTMAVVLAACYGVPVDDMYQSLITAKDSSGEPINGLKVTLVTTANDSIPEFTNENGEAIIRYFQDEEASKLIVEDVDGADNGGEFLKNEQDYDGSDSTVDLTMTRKSE